MPCYYARSLNDSRVTVNKCARDSGLKSCSANNSGNMRFLFIVHDFGRRLNQSPFRPRAEISFPRAPQFREYNGKEASSASMVTAELCVMTNAFRSFSNTSTFTFFGILSKRRKTSTKKISKHVVNGFVRIQVAHQSFQKSDQVFIKSYPWIGRFGLFTAFIFFTGLLTIVLFQQVLCFSLIMLLVD